MNDSNYFRITPAEAERLRMIAENYNNANQPRYNEGVNFMPVLDKTFNDNQLYNIAYSIMQGRRLGDIPFRDLGLEKIDPYEYRKLVDANRKNKAFNKQGN